MSNSSIWSIDRTLSGVSTPGQRGSRSDSNEVKLLYISQNSSIIGSLPSYCLMPYPGLLGGVLPLCRDVVGVFYSPRWLFNAKSYQSLSSSSCRTTSTDLPWPSHASCLYHPLPPVGLQGYIMYRHRDVVHRF